MFTYQYAPTYTNEPQQAYYGAYGSAAQNAVYAAPPSNETSQSGSFPAADYSPMHHQAPLPAAPQSSCLKAIQMGFQVYAALTPEARRDLHARGRKPKSFRKIASDRGIPVSTLWRAIAVYLLYRRHPEIGSYQHLGVAHLSVILGVAPENQLYFLRMAELERWSRRRLDQEVKRWQAYAKQYRAAMLAQQQPMVQQVPMPPNAVPQAPQTSFGAGDPHDSNR